MLVWIVLVFTCSLLTASTLNLPKNVGEVIPVPLNAAVPGFYPSDPVLLKSTMDNFFVKSKVVKMLVVPHAGIVYSGQCAAVGYEKLLGREDIKTVIIVGPAHKAIGRGIGIVRQGTWRNELGFVELDEDLAKKIEGCLDPKMLMEESVSSKEHSLKIQMPFLQTVLQRGFKIVPIYCNNIDYAESLAQAIYRSTRGRNDVFVVVSTDLSHYNPVKNAMNIDQQTISAIASLNASKFVAGCKAGRYQACGAAGVAMAMFLANLSGYVFGELARDTSASSAIGDDKSVVGYLAAEFFTDQLPKKLQDFLLNIARKSIANSVAQKETNFAAEVYQRSLLVSKEVFVTLTKAGSLRGCIGNLGMPKSLYKAVIDSAINATLHDPRFLPVSQEELNTLEVEISILSAKQKISDPAQEFELGTHGIVIEKNGKSAIYLPEVAVEQHWNVEQALQSLCHKADLPMDAWREGASFSIFTTQKIRGRM